MKKNKGIIVLATTALLMFGSARASDESVERLTQLMKGISTATTEADKDREASNDVDSLFYLAKNSPFNVEALTDALIRLKTVGFRSNYLKPLVYGVAHFGGNSNALHQAAFTVQESVTRRTLSMEDMKQLDEAIPSASKLMARALGLSMADMDKQISRGSVKSKEAVFLMLSDMEIEFFGEAIKWRTASQSTN